MSQNPFAGSSLVITTLQSLNSYMSQSVSLLSQINNSIIQSSTAIVQSIGALGTYIGPKFGGAIPYANQFQIAMGKLLSALGTTPLSNISNTAKILGTQTPILKSTSEWDKIKATFSGGTQLFSGIKNGVMAGAKYGFQALGGKNNLLMSGPIGVGSGIIGGLLGGVGGVFKGIGQSMSPMVNQFKTMGPQMLMMSLVMGPIQALLEGILTPLEPLTEIFGAFGEILGTSLIPLVNMIMSFLMPMIPILQGVANLLAPILPLLFQILTPFGQLMAIFQIISAFMPPDIAAWFNNLPTIIGDALTNAGTWLSTQLGNLWNIVVDFFGNLGFQLGVVLTKMINDTFKSSLGGADANMFTSV